MPEACYFKQGPNTSVAALSAPSPHLAVTLEQVAQFRGSGLAGPVRVLSTNVDRVGRPFISSYELAGAPVYAVQFHPERPIYEWSPVRVMPHTPQAINANGWLAQFFVNETRRNTRGFSTPAAESSALIYRWNPVDTAADDNEIFEQCYMFPSEYESARVRSMYASTPSTCSASPRSATF